MIKLLPAFTLLLLCGCANTIKKAVPSDYSAPPPGKGLLAITVSKTVEDPKYVHNEGLVFTLMKKELDTIKQTTITVDFTLNEKNETTGIWIKPMLIELDAGEYNIYPAAPFGLKTVEPIDNKITINAGTITYVGEYNVKLITEGENFFSAEIKRASSHIRDNRQENIKVIFNKYQNVKSLPVIYNVPEERDFVTRRVQAPPQTTIIYIPKVEKKRQ